MALTISKVCQGISPSVTLKMNALVAELRAQGKDIIGLGAGEPDFDTPAHIRAAALKAMETGCTRYTATNGIPALRKALSAFLLADKGLQYAPDEIIVGTGAKQSLLGALQAILDPDDEVILPAPCWISYPEMIHMAGGKAVWLHTDESQGFVPSREQVLSVITPRTKAIIINTPSNPTGAVWGREQLQAVGDLAVEYGFYIISDEIYDKLIYDGAQHVSVASLSDEIKAHTITVNGFSKAYAMTGWRMGYACGPKDVIKAMDAYQSHATGNPNSIAQYAALAAITGDQTCVADMAKAFSQRRKLMVDCLNKIGGVSCFTPQGAFYVLLNVNCVIGKRCNGRIIRSSNDFAELLLEHAQVAVVDGEPFGAPGYCRLSYAISEERILEAVRRIEQFISCLEAAA